ncbi:hypothetical protein HY029_04495 [Candidatus Gottesmanbacteria bacterium]|nr:hypothetical protein [Candidatus Gottesmanbacteria bacterium]
MPDDKLWEALRVKQEFAEKYGKNIYMVTQMCLITENLPPWIEKIRKNGITLPIMVGVPGVISPKGLVKFLLEYGTENIERILANHPELREAYDIVKMGKAIMTNEVFDAGKLLEEIVSIDGDNNFSGIHFTTFNQPEKTLQLCKNLINE